MLEQLLQAKVSANPDTGNANMDDSPGELHADDDYTISPPPSTSAANGIITSGTDVGYQLNRIPAAPADMMPPIATASISAEFEKDSPSDLSSEVGLLCVNAAGREPQYFGPSSSFSFSRILSSGFSRLPNQYEPSLGKINSTQLHGNPAACPPEPLPSRAIGAMLSKTYFANINPQYPFLHQPTFAEWEDELMTAFETGDSGGRDPSISYFVFMVRLDNKSMVLSCRALTAQVYAVASLVIPGNLESSAEIPIPTYIITIDTKI